MPADDELRQAAEAVIKAYDEGSWCKYEIKALRAALSAPTPEPTEAVTQEQIQEWAAKACMLDAGADSLEIFAANSYDAGYAAGRAAAGKDAEDARRLRQLPAVVQRLPYPDQWGDIDWLRNAIDKASAPPLSRLDAEKQA